MLQQLREMSKSVSKFGYFKRSDTQLVGLRYGNWGSRPYEYCWAAQVEDVEDKDILDIGTGTPSEHNWHEFVDEVLKPRSYLGVDFDERLKMDNINRTDHKVLYMDASSLELENDSIDVIYSISTFEHVDSVKTFNKIIEECHRVLRHGGKMVVTLDEYWDCKVSDCLPWNELERAYARERQVHPERSYGMVDFANDIQHLFKPVGEIPEKVNADGSLLYSAEYNDCVSYGVFQVVK